jgi:hypothetical protein
MRNKLPLMDTGFIFDNLNAASHQQSKHRNIEKDQNSLYYGVGIIPIKKKGLSIHYFKIRKWKKR